jgi:hypothetical protein
VLSIPTAFIIRWRNARRRREKAFQDYLEQVHKTADEAIHGWLK